MVSLYVEGRSKFQEGQRHGKAKMFLLDLFGDNMGIGSKSADGPLNYSPLLFAFIGYNDPIPDPSKCKSAKSLLSSSPLNFSHLVIVPSPA